MNEEVTEEEFMSMSDEERIKYLIGIDLSKELTEENILEAMMTESHLKEDEYKLDPEESDEMFSQMFPTDWMNTDIGINTHIGRDMICMYKDSYYEDIKKINSLLWKVMMNVDLNSILKEYYDSKLDEVLYQFIGEAKYHVVEHSFHKDFNVDEDMVKRMVLAAKLHDLTEIYETLYRTAKVINAMKGKIKNESN